MPRKIVNRGTIFFFFMLMTLLAWAIALVYVMFFKRPALDFMDNYNWLRK